MKYKVKRDIIVEGQLIRKGSIIELNETVSGNYLIGYHRTKDAQHFIEGTNKMGLIINPGAINWHGYGFYMVENIESSLEYGGEYGDYLIKCYIKSDKILHLSKKNRMKAFGKDLTLVEQLTKFGVKLDAHQISELNYLNGTIEAYDNHYPIFEEIRKLLFQRGNNFDTNKIAPIGLDGVTLSDSHDGDIIVVFNLIGTIIVDGYWNIDSDRIRQPYNKIDHKTYNVKNIVNTITPKSQKLASLLDNNAFNIFTKYNTTEKLSKLIGRDIKHLYDMPDISLISYKDNIRQLNRIGIYIPYLVRSSLDKHLDIFNGQFNRLLTPNIITDFINTFEPNMKFEIKDGNFHLIIDKSKYNNIWSFMMSHWNILFYDLIENDKVINTEVDELLNEIKDVYEAIRLYRIREVDSFSEFIKIDKLANYHLERDNILSYLNEKIFNKLKSLV